MYVLKAYSPVNRTGSPQGFRSNRVTDHFNSQNVEDPTIRTQPVTLQDVQTEGHSPSNTLTQDRCLIKYHSPRNTLTQGRCLIKSQLTVPQTR